MNHNPRIALLLAGLLVFSVRSGFAQRILEKNAAWRWKDRIYYGGGIDLGWGTSYFGIGLNPVVGLMIAPKASIGANGFWQYQKYNDSKTAELHLFGFNGFGRYNIFPFLFVYAEAGFINAPISLTDNSNRRTIPRLPLGLGYSQALGQRGMLNVMILYDALYNSNKAGSVYSSPWIFRINFVY